MVAHSEILLLKCAQFKEQGEFIDVHLKVGEELFSAHRIVLAASSDYFHAMFAHGMKESNQEVIELKDESISAAALKIVLDSIYSGDLQVNDENVFDVLVAADHLQVTSVVQQCCDYLRTQFVQLRFDVQTFCQLCTIANRHGLTDLQEATQSKMASMYKDVCETEEFLSNVDADQFSHLLSRDDLSAPSETFVFKSVIKWIKHKKEERMPLAAKVIEAVRLGLVDIREMIRELSSEEMQQVPEIHTLLYESLLYSYIPSSSAFGEEKGKLRSTGSALVAVLPGTSNMHYFDFKSKLWKPLTSLAPPAGTTSIFCAVTVGSKIFVAGATNIYCYDLEKNIWEKHSHSNGKLSHLCTVGDYMYAFNSDCNEIPQRYSFSERQWQSFAKVTMPRGVTFFNSGTAVLHSKVFVLYGKGSFPGGRWAVQNSFLLCFDPAKNIWEGKASTCLPHFGSSLLEVNGKLYVAGGTVDILPNGSLRGNPATVEVYDQDNNKWSVVDQKRIPQNKLGAVEIEGRVYFIIEKLPIDSGIRIPPGEVYPVSLHKWENLVSQISFKNGTLCYAPLKTESLNTTRKQRKKEVNDNVML